MAITSPPQHRWTLADALETYGIRNWGNPYFGINDKGHVCVHPDGPQAASMDLKELVEEVRRRGIGLPLLIRFTDVLRHRVRHLNEAFKKAITEQNYKGQYRGVYPIKVNQHRYVVETIVETGKQYGYGLEAGSKPELLAVMALLDNEDALVICNGYKDEEYVETALFFSRLGRKVILVVEKPSELPLIAEVARRTGIAPRLGVRVRLSTRGAGKWEASGGDRSKFGLTSSELMASIAFMRETGLLQHFELLHFHLGSQISNIRNVKNALREVGCFYVEVARQGAPLQYLDVGGGLGVDYDGSQTNFTSSMNYTTEEYANDVVFGVMEACDRAGVAHPTIVSESGRAVVAHHAVLVMDVLGTSEFDPAMAPDKVDEKAPSVVRNLVSTLRDVTNKNLLESWHDAQDSKEESLTLFSLGHLSLEQRVAAENVYWAICHKIMRIAREAGEIPEELESLEKQLSDTYFCNFSVFQSLPDSWAIDQLFPVMPIHRLNEKPTRKAVLADITCDSDGKIEHFIDKREVKDSLELHPLNDDDYLLGIFLVGAYQEILGDLHNLFGDTHAVQVSLAPNGGYLIDHVVEGDTVNEVLHYVSYNKDDLVARLRKFTEVALRQGRISLDESRTLLRMYEEGLSGYTYLERDVDAKFASANHGQLRLVAPHDTSVPPRITPPPTGT
ncbi:biosynthetic arginine decarboxylase [Hyalangium minutum]|uniref:Biosynthetic arginine decarboxylase n=1 Tax=Hyalangium minutum TaxID=394096 RepID=A0A085WAS7_9BACT|nr:biosynthetic arginine decarboxylase [Hyalangium minutum]KFE64790.1 Biosynthetic arginine decarboxylase [Hyalangium minutum]